MDRRDATNVVHAGSNPVRGTRIPRLAERPKPMPAKHLKGGSTPLSRSRGSEHEWQCACPASRSRAGSSPVDSTISRTRRGNCGRCPPKAAVAGSSPAECATDRPAGVGARLLNAQRSVRVRCGRPISRRATAVHPVHVYRLWNSSQPFDGQPAPVRASSFNRQDGRL